MAIERPVVWVRQYVQSPRARTAAEPVYLAHGIYSFDGAGSRRVSIRSFLSNVVPKRAPTLERANRAYAEGRKADAAVLFRALAEDGSALAQLRLAQLYERGDGVLQSFVEAV